MSGILVIFGRDEKRRTTLALGWAVLLLLGQGGPNVEWIIHLCLRNTRREEIHYRSGGPIAAFVPAAVGICRDDNQYCRGNETTTHNGVP